MTAARQEPQKRPRFKVDFIVFCDNYFPRLVNISVKYFRNFKRLEITGHNFGNVITVHKPRLEGTNREGE
jgi:hypothetical protein